MNRIRYAHRVEGHAEVTGVTPGSKGHDSFRFILSDRTNETPIQTFYIHIRTRERGALRLSTRPARITEGERLVLNSNYLLAQDSGPPQDLVYRVQDGPRLGTLSLVSAPGVPLKNFTQLDVTAQRVCYTHDNSHQGAQDSVSFVVSNGVSSVFGSLLVHIVHLDRIPPSLVQNSGLRVQEGSTGIITRSHLLLTDPDTAAANLTYEITQMPRYGKLLLHGTPLDRTNRRFSQWDLDRAGVTYRHDPKTRASIDAFHFLPTDQSNTGFLLYGRISTEPAVFTIQIERPDSPPSLVSRLSPSLVSALGSGRFGIILDRSNLQASDPDSDDQDLTYTITSGPQHGHLENMLTGSYIQSRFTQRDVNQKSVVYLLPVDVDVTNDHFLLVLSDPAGNSLPPRRLDLSWSRVQFSASCFRTCETSGTLQIQVQRTGSSSDPAYVSIQVEGGGAKVGVDFTHSSASLLQFDPGVNVKTWNIFPIADGLEENHESFTVHLKKPQNTVLGTRTSARVEILDPRQGRCDPFETFEDFVPLVPPGPDPGLSPGPDPGPDPGPEKDLDPVTEIETELIFEPDPRSPPRGDVPNRELDFSLRDQAWTQDQDQTGLYQDLRDQTWTHPKDLRRYQTQVQTQVHKETRVDPGQRVHLSTERGQERVWTFHALTPLRVEQVQDQPLRDAPAPAEGATSPREPAEGATSPREPAEGATSPREPAEGATSPREPAEGATSPPETPGGATAPQSVCPSGSWTLHRRRCFLLSSSVASWSSAQHSCSQLWNSSLVSVQSRRDLFWLWRFSGRRSFWTDFPDAVDRDAVDRDAVDRDAVDRDAVDRDAVNLSGLKGATSPHCVLIKNPKNWIQTNCSTDSEHHFICSRPGPDQD
ncbi:FRAS1-related extracellular matrix protein 1-like [Boleophthalmus pectinirostris]|uniref:FRAS1-related extracellular matrix protein 1-like n=1 Tax=Boleophthalmus pectinirostris TaxID=150288 RepID=UPI00242BDE1D|nr:FRAS1-related extracellular matrix protein 1-like [Boleophthalmus pectinirostris]XP_055020927.1 FRAS1-related extracellular matrix protein 1-like [Boleophthalmus pectinirostris]